MTQEEKDIFFMTEALAEAYAAAELDEVPVGAVAVFEDTVIARAGNRRESRKCATCHAELSAIEEACRYRHGWRLPDCTLYVTLEPCPMCAGAIINARIPRVVYGASDPKGGAFGSVIDLCDYPFNHHPEVTRGVLAEESRQILSAYFKNKREK